MYQYAMKVVSFVNVNKIKNKWFRLGGRWCGRFRLQMLAKTKTLIFFSKTLCRFISISIYLYGQDYPVACSDVNDNVILNFSSD